ncbi:MAG TPA: flavodoxin family protein [Deferrisomatales bacterium]|nr:flavodoxin family protein [Deferrisomatales bacterium]
MTDSTQGGAASPRPRAGVLCLHGSPRAGGNTDLLLEAVASGVNAVGGQPRHLYCRDLDIRPCTGCGACSAIGSCVIRDDMSTVYAALDEAAAVVIGSPVYFLGVPSLCKGVIDRFQPYWARRHLLGIPPGALRPGALVATAGAPSHSVFSGAQRTVEALFEVVDITCKANLLYEGIDARGAITDHPTALDEAQALGRRLGARPPATP